MLSLVHPYPNEQMHILFCFLVATATFYSFPAFARPPSPAFEFQERPPLKQVLIEPEFSNLFTPTTEQTVSVGLLLASRGFLLQGELQLLITFTTKYISTPELDNYFQMVVS